MVKRIIEKQYNQLLEVCKQMEAEIEHLSRNLKDGDFAQRLEIERMQELIVSIEQDVQIKKQGIYNSEIKNKYQQLTDLYQKTNNEIRILESHLVNNTQMVDTDLDITSKWMSDDGIHNMTSQPSFDSQARRERLNLSVAIEPQQDDIHSHYERVVKKWHDKKWYNNLNELEEKQSIEEPVSILNTEPQKSTRPALFLQEEEKSAVVKSFQEMPETKMERSKIPPSIFDLSEVPEMASIFAESKVPIPEERFLFEEQAESKVPIPEEKLLFEEKAEPKIPILEEKTLLKEQIEKQSQEAENSVNTTHKKKYREKKPRKGNRVIGIILVVMVCLILISVSLVVFLFGIYSPTEEPRVLFGHSIMRVTANTIAPELPIDTFIITRQVNQTDVQVGEVAAFMRPNEPTVIHRISEIHENPENMGIREFRLITDPNNHFPPSEIYQATDLIGRVVVSNDQLGPMLMFIYYNFITIMIVVIWIPILMLLFMFKGTDRTKDKGSKKKKSLQNNELEEELKKL